MEENRNDLFPGRHAARVHSPEQLNDFVRVASPGVWLTLVTVLLFLLGTAVWAVFGHLDTTIKVPLVSEEGILRLYIAEDDLDSIKGGEPFTAEGFEMTVGTIDQTPVQAGEVFGTYWLHTFGMWEDQWVFPAECLGTASVPEGVYPAKVLIESVSPFYIIFN